MNLLHASVAPASAPAHRRGMIRIDGNMGEGGGQVLRSCVSLSLLTGKSGTVRVVPEVYSGTTD